MGTQTKKLLIVMGTRPEAIKMAPIIKELQKHSEFEVLVGVTAQHRELLDQVLKLFEITPDFDLNLMRAGQSLPDLTSVALTELYRAIENRKIDRILVHGDTTTTLAASLAAYYCKIPVAHVEAGLRTQNLYSPWPEEANRKLTGALANLHFAPTETAAENLVREGVARSQIHVTGNSVIDAVIGVADRISKNSELQTRLRSKFQLTDGKKLVLLTAHRRENFGAGIAGICNAVRELVSSEPVEFVFPVHPNPNVQGPVREALSGVNGVHLVDPLDYTEFVYLMKRCAFALTDSGGIQEEAPALGKPVLVMRETTERPEAVSAGTAMLVGTDPTKIVGAVRMLLKDPNEYERMSRAKNPYGDGQTSRRIAEILKKC